MDAKSRTGKCKICGATYTQAPGKGKGRTYCTEQCRLTGRRLGKSQRVYQCCKVEGCEGNATRVGVQLCELHHARLRRTGLTEARPHKVVCAHSSGYLRMLNKRHPLADSTGYVYQHRSVAYDMHRGLCPPCFWCNVRLDWAWSVVDHLNEQKADNHPDNLVVCCAPCNRARGALIPFVERMTELGWQAFIAVANVHRRKVINDMI